MVNLSYDLPVINQIHFSALIDGVLHNDAFKHRKNEDMQQTWTTLLRDLKLYEDATNPVEFLRQKLVLGASQWLSGMHGSKENEKVKFGYSDSEWELIWSLMIEDGAWAVPVLRDKRGNYLKDNFAPEMMIRYAAHELKCHIIVVDLQLARIQFCSGNFLKDDNTIFESPLILYATGNHFQSVFQKDHEYFIQLAHQLDIDDRSENITNSEQYDTTSRTTSYNNMKGKTQEQSEEIRNEVNEKRCKSIEGNTECKVTGKTIATSASAKTLSDAERKRISRSRQKNPDYKKKPPLTPAERKRRSRQSKSAEEKNKVKEVDRKRKAAKRESQSLEERNTQKNKEIRNEDNEKRCKSIEGKSECKVTGKTIATSTSVKTLSDAERKRISRSRQTNPDYIKKPPLTPAERKRHSRQSKSAEEKNKAKEVNKCRRAAKRQDAKSGVCANEAINSEEIMNGRYIVLDVKDTKDDIGNMDTKCQYCQAYKFRKESPTTCCSNGKVVLEGFPTPPKDINDLWQSNTIKGRLFRDNARSINNAVCLASLQVKQRNFKRGFSPSIIFEGKVQQFVGPLQAQEGETPRFAQLYVHDPKLESSIRFENMSIPECTSNVQKQILRDVLKTIQNALHKHNPFIKDFKQVMDIPKEDLGDGKLIISAKNRPRGEHERRYNQQVNLQEISILRNSEPNDIVIQQRGGPLQIISDLNPKGMPLHFTLLFPYGTYGWDLMLKHTDGKRRVTTREFYVYHLNIRDVPKDYLHLAGRLFQEWICMAWVAVENQKLNFQRHNQKALRADTYRNIREATEEKLSDLSPRVDGMFRDDSQQPSIGRKILSSSFAGSPRWYNAKFQDGMAICREYHKPDYFITMTCNPHWPEIQMHLKEGQSTQDRPDIVSRVFKQKKDQLMDDLKHGDIFGKVVAHMHVIEFQKRGLPHVHILIILANKDRPVSSDKVDSIVVAELPPSPDDTDDPDEKAQRKRLQDIVMTNMIHGPCGSINPNSPCMEDGKCLKKYPKPFQKETTVDPDNNYAIYRRRSPKDGGLQHVCPKTKRVIDNSWVVPYSPFLTLRFNCHINVEICTSPKASKYLYKYVTKGSDRAMVATVVAGQCRDEISDYEDLRSVGSSEATWHLMSFPITERFPPVMALRVHTEDQQQVVFDEGSEEEALERQRETELTAFFQLNQKLLEEDSSDIEVMPLYVELPKKFRYDKSKKKWIPRHPRSEDVVIGRLHTINPLAGETFYLRMLLHHDHCRGKISFDDMKSLQNGKTCETYKEVCRELGLLKDDLEWQRVLEESAVTKLCPQIRELFVIILMFCEPANPRELFDSFWNTWVDDFDQQGRRQGNILNEFQLKVMLLLDLEMRLQSFEKQLGDFGLPQPTEEDLACVRFFSNTDPVVIREEKDYHVEQLTSSLEQIVPLFTPEQLVIYNEVLEAVSKGEQLLAFVDARGGCGKTFLLNAILSAVRSSDKDGCVALAMATTGIAANLLDLGRTFHSRLKATLTPTEESTLQINAQSSLAKLVRMAKLLLIDEATMLDRLQLEAMDRSLRDLMGNTTQLFGGKIILLAGDFRQCLPVIPGANRAGTVSHCINRSSLWQHFKIYGLTENMRVRASGDTTLENFDKWTLGIGNGECSSDVVPIPEEMITEIVPNTKTQPWNEEQSMRNFCRVVFPDLKTNICKPGWLEGRTILAPTNKEVDAINNIMQESLPESGIKLSSADTLGNPEDAFRFNSEYLHTLRPNGFPQHMLNLKPGIPLMLLRNINPRQGLCNGTRLIFDKCLDNKLLQCRIVESGRVVLIPRITFIPKLNEYPFEWQRRQFPVRTSFAISINKSQGQTLKFVGVWLRGQVFTHGQLYVACSRVSSPSNLRFALQRLPEGKNFTASNIVFKEILL